MFHQFVNKLCSKKERDLPSPVFSAISYPKTGTTWFQFELAKYVQIISRNEQLVFFDDIDRVRQACRTAPNFVGGFTHAPLTWNSQAANDLSAESVVDPFRELKVILMVRHPLDTLVSHYMQMKHQVGSFKGDLVDFINDDVFGLEKLIRFYSIWAENKHGLRGFYLRRYEDARKDPGRILKEILAFLGESPHQAAVDEAVSFASFRNMRDMESRGAELVYPSSNLPVFGPGDRSNPDAFHVRKGEVGGYRTHLSGGQAEKFEALIARNLPVMFGYS
ncbi:sulfotransferase domain-containing protein [Paramagnetospirillum kuznetsovii]|nr:sulfotransferase domain-containing protein [Paramagnetospirillum kuznetsovii]